MPYIATLSLYDAVQDQTYISVPNPPIFKVVLEWLKRCYIPNIKFIYRVFF